MPPDSTSGDSIRPPDLRPDAVRDASSDVLADWDIGAWKESHPHEDRRPFPTDTVALVVATVLGLTVGGSIDHARPGRSAVIGAVGCVLVTAAVRRLWESPA